MANPRIVQIFRLARQKLGDLQKERWSDQDLLDLLDLGHKDLARHAKFLRSEVTLPVVIGQAKYQLPPDVYNIIRAEYANEVLTLTTYDRMDDMARTAATSSRDFSAKKSYPNSDFGDSRLTSAWMAETGPEPTALIYDKQNLCEVRVYPIPEVPNDAVHYTFENESGIDLPFVGAELLGVVTGMEDYTFDSPFGVVTDLYDPYYEDTFNSVDGCVSDVYESSGEIVIRYIKVPDTIANLDSDILSHSAYDTALMHYIVGNALLNDLDERNSARGQAELVMYQRELENAQKDSSLNAVRRPGRTTSYIGGFE